MLWLHKLVPTISFWRHISRSVFKNTGTCLIDLKEAWIKPPGLIQLVETQHLAAFLTALMGPCSLKTALPSTEYGHASSCSTEMLWLGAPVLLMTWWVQEGTKEQLAANQMQKWSFPVHKSPLLPVLSQRKHLRPQIRQLNRSLCSPSISLQAFL